MHAWQKFRSYITLVGGLWAYGFTSVMLFIFYMAYFQPDKQVTIDVNMFGEGDIEFLVFTFIAVPGMIASLYHIIVKNKGLLQK